MKSRQKKYYDKYSKSRQGIADTSWSISSLTTKSLDITNHYPKKVSSFKAPEPRILSPSPHPHPLGTSLDTSKKHTSSADSLIHMLSSSKSTKDKDHHFYHQQQQQQQQEQDDDESFSTFCYKKKKF